MDARIRAGDLRTRGEYRITVLILLFGLLVAAILISISIGSSRIPLGQVVKSLLFEKESVTRRILIKIRLPRVAAGGLVGCCLALSGCLLQGIMGNPLASPNILGVSSGAGLAAVTILILLPEFYYLLTPFAFLGALITTLFVYLLAWKGGASPLRLVLSGVAAASFLGAGTNMLMTLYPDRVQNVVGFMVGSLSSVTWQSVNGLWPYALVGFITVNLMANGLNLLQLGDETALSLGLKTERVRMIFIVISSLMASASVSVVGLLGFVGLIVPHLTRLLIGNNARYLIPGSALTGALLVVTCDLIGRTILRPLELPVGVIMALLGAPFFLYLLRKGGVYGR
ncbi:MAG: iron ABC transporter permease [Spirochaetales bacterium]|nr:iron ABC transporter permease [Spirochaetales bacterium]